MNQWSTREKLYPRLLSMFKSARKSVPDAKVAAMLWHQGESDSDSKKVANAYQAKLIKHISSIRKDTKEPNLLFILGQINPAKSFCGRPRFLQADIVRKAQEELKVDNTVMIKTDDCEKNPYTSGCNTPEKSRVPGKEDNIHYSAKGQIKMGARFAEAYLTNSMDIFLLIGQSNMAGRAPILLEDKGVIDDCMLLNDKDIWEPAKVPFNRYSTIRKGLGMQKLNPGYGFVKTMLEKGVSSSIGLVVNAKGGSKIAQWKKGTKFYKDAVRRTKAAMKKGNLVGIIWHQGESDSKDTNYLGKLKELIANLRKDLGNEKLPFVAGQVFYHAKTKNNTKLINDQLVKLPTQVPFTQCVKSEGLTTIDNTHFDNRSQKTLGKRYAAAMIKLLNK